MTGPRKRLLRWHRPAVQTELPLPQPADTDRQDTPAEIRWWQQPAAVLSLAALAALLLVVVVASQVSVRREHTASVELATKLKTATLRAPTRERSLLVRPNPRSWSASPDASLVWPEPPEMIELLMPVGYARYREFAVTIDKTDQGRMMVLQRLLPDSNGDLRISLNSSAFGPGEYRLRLQGYTWRGQRVDVGWARVVVSQPALKRAASRPADA